MTLRLHVPQPLAEGQELALPEGAARHVQVRRLQPGEALQLFDGRGGEWQAVVVAMGRREVLVRVGAPALPTPELPIRVTLAVGVPANERMDALVEKAAELGVAAIQPLWCERAVVRLDGERLRRRQAHWQAIAAAACEQCGRATVPVVDEPADLALWLARLSGTAARWLLSPAPAAPPVAALGLPPGAVLALSGPEGGLAPGEQKQALDSGFVPVSLGPRVLRADTAPLALLAWLALQTDAARVPGGLER